MVAPIQSTPSTSPLSHNDLLRRQLRAEFVDIDRMIHAAVVLDLLTEEISDWLNNFREDLDNNPDTESVYQRYVELLQDLLCDPVTGAPLDDPQFGVEDGYTYGSKSLYVTQTPRPVNERHLSPMTRQPLTLVPHVLASYMILWLALRNNALFSRELEEEYRKAVAQRETEAAERLNRLAQRRLARQQACEQAADKERLRLQNRLTTIHEERQADFQQLAEQIQAIPTPLREVEQEIKQAEERPVISVEAIRHQMQQIANDQFAPLETRINAYAVNTIAQLAQEEAQEKKDFDNLKGLVAGAERQVTHLAQQNNELEDAGKALQVKIDTLTKEQIQLDNNIKQLREEIARRRKKKGFRGLDFVICAVASVAVSVGLKAMGVPLSINFSSGGFSASVSKPL